MIDERKPPAPVRYVSIPAGELPAFREANPDARMVSWPHNQHGPMIYGFYVKESEG